MIIHSVVRWCRYPHERSLYNRCRIPKSQKVQMNENTTINLYYIYATVTYYMHLGYQNVDCNPTAVWNNLMRIVHIKDFRASYLNWASLSAAIVPMISDLHKGIFSTLWPSSSIFHSSFIAIPSIPISSLSRLPPLLIPPISCPLAWENEVVNKDHSSPPHTSISHSIPAVFLFGRNIRPGFLARNFGQKITVFGRHICRSP
jgi:hypothetical protein